MRNESPKIPAAEVLAQFQASRDHMAHEDPGTQSSLGCCKTWDYG